MGIWRVSGLLAQRLLIRNATVTQLALARFGLGIRESSEANAGPTSNQIPGALTRVIIG
jgi:hypothetical protein